MPLDRIKTLVFLFLFSASYFLQAQTYATTETHGESVSCSGCKVDDPSHAVDNNYHGTHSVLDLTVSTSGAYVYQKLKFPHSATAGHEVIAIVEDHSPRTLNATLLGSVRLTTFHNGISNADTKGSNQFHISQLAGSSTQYLIEFKPSNAYDEVEIELEAGVPGALTQLRVYSAYYSASVLPVELLYFKGTHSHGTNILSWATASEINNSHFLIERSADGITFESIGKVTGAGSTNERQEYSFVDEHPEVTEHYYRLRQTDHDGLHKLHNVISITSKHSKALGLAVHGNPFAHTLTLSYEAIAAGSVNLTLTDLYGNTVYTSTFASNPGTNHFMFGDLGHLPHGHYVLHLIDGDHSDMQHLVKM